MKDTNRIRTEDLSVYGILAALSAVAAVLNCFPEFTDRWYYAPMMLCIFVWSVWMLIRNLLRPVYLTPEGIEFHRRGQLQRLLPWSQVAQVSLLKRYRFSMKTSQTPLIVITPVGCPVFDGTTSGGAYLRSCGSQVIRATYSGKCIRFIEEHYGPLSKFT